MQSSSSSTDQEFAEALTIARVVGKSSPADLLPGTTLNGNYQVIKMLASGSMGTVYLCRHNKLADRLIAVKILSAELAADRAMRKRFADEICNTYDVSHPNVIRTYEYFEDGDMCGFSMEYADGGDLLSLTEKHGQLPVAVVVGLLKQMCSGVAAIHQAGIVHRDIKPENMLLTKEKQIKVSDFGIAYSKARSRKALSGNVEGAIDYLSPEYIESGHFDERSDIFALGMIAFRLLAGRTPTETEDVFEALQSRVNQDIPAVSVYRADCPAFLVEFVRKCVARDPEKRFQHVSEMLAALNLASQPQAQRPVLKPAAPVLPGVVPTGRRPGHALADPSTPGLLSRLFVTFAITAGMMRIVYLDGSYPQYIPQLMGFGTQQEAAVRLKKLPVIPEIPEYYTHKVRNKGETLAVVSFWYTGEVENWRTIAEANPQLDVNRISIGQEILIPYGLVRQFGELGVQELETVREILKARRAQAAAIQSAEEFPHS